MNEDFEEGLSQAESGLYSDYERFSALLNEAQRLSKENRNYNALVIREYFSVLGEIYNTMLGFVGKTLEIKRIEKNILLLDILTRNVHLKLLSDSEYKVSFKVFHFLEGLHRDLEMLRNISNLGIQKKKRFTGGKKLDLALE